MNCYTRQQIKDTVLSKGYKWFESGNYNLNIVGVRNSETDGVVTNKFDDCLTVSYNVDGEEKFHCFQATTDPGTHWEKNLLNSKGVAILVPGQYRGSHKIRKHRGQYDALCQQKTLPVYRDNNKDGVYDMLEENIDEGIFGINIHRATKWAGKTSTQIDKWSAGCQVIAANDDFRLFMEIANKGKDLWGNAFTYTLIESKDIVA